MSKRLTLSERFDGLAPPKYDDMVTNEEYAEDIDADGNSQSNGNTTFTVVSRATGSSSAANNRSQRISHVMGPNRDATSSSNTKYGPSRATGTRNFRRPLNPDPYSPIKSQTQLPSTKPQFHTNRKQQGQTRTDNYQTSHNNSRFGESDFNSHKGFGQNRGDFPRRKNNQGMNTNMNNNANTNTGMRGPRTSVAAETRYDGRGQIGSGPRGNFGNRRGEDFGRKNRGGRGGNRTGIRTGGGGKGNGGNTNRMRNTNKNDLSEQQLDKELEKYYATNDPKKLSEMKNEELDREMDEYWTAPEEQQPPSNGDVNSKKASKATMDQ